MIGQSSHPVGTSSQSIPYPSFHPSHISNLYLEEFGGPLPQSLHAASAATLTNIYACRVQSDAALPSHPVGCVITKTRSSLNTDPGNRTHELKDQNRTLRFASPMYAQPLRQRAHTSSETDLAICLLLTRTFPSLETSQPMPSICRLNVSCLHRCRIARGVLKMS